MISKHIHGCFMSMDYRIVGNFEGENFRKLVKNTIFAEKTFADCSLCCTKGRHAPKFHGVNFHK